MAASRRFGWKIRTEIPDYPAATWEAIVGTGFCEIVWDLACPDYLPRANFRDLKFVCGCEVAWDQDSGRIWNVEPCRPHIGLSPWIDVVVWSQEGGEPTTTRRRLLDTDVEWGTWVTRADTNELFASKVDSSG